MSLRPLLTGVSVAGLLGALGAPAGAVTGGEPDSTGWPWAAALLNDWMPAGRDYSRSFCSGTLIAPAVVLTAKHCVGSIGPGDVHVVVGDDDLTQASEPDAIAVTAIRVHPSADLAVLDLDRSAAQPPAPLARADDWASVATGAGFGDTSAGSGAGSPELESLDLRLQTDRTCKSWWDDAYDPRTMLCAGGVIGRDMCEGDSGGPLMLDDGGGWRLLGVTLFGDSDCGSSGAPGVFAWVSGAALRDWVVAQGASSPPSSARGARAWKSHPRRRAR